MKMLRRNSFASDFCGDGNLLLIDNNDTVQGLMAGPRAPDPELRNRTHARSPIDADLPLKRNVTHK